MEDFNLHSNSSFLNNNPITNDNNIPSQSNSGTASLTKKEPLEESNILAWIEKYYGKGDLTLVELNHSFGEEWILEEKGDKAYLARTVTWELTIGGKRHVLEQKLKTSVEYPSGGALEQEKALHRANFCIHLYTETLMLPVKGIGMAGFKADELAKATILRFDFGQNQVFSKHTVVKVYNPSKGASQPDYCLSVKLGDDIESIFQDAVGIRIVGSDQVERRSGFKARKLLNGDKEVILLAQDDKNNYIVSDQECIEVRELLSEKIMNARFEIKNADYILNREPEKGFKSFFNNAKENVKELFGMSDLEKKPLMERLDQVQSKIGKVGQDIKSINEKIRQKRIDSRSAQGDVQKQNSLNAQIVSLQEERDSLTEQIKPLKEIRDELMETAEKVLHQMTENQIVFEKNSEKLLRVAVHSLYRMATEILKAKNEGKNPDDHDYYYADDSVSNENLNSISMNDQQRYNALLKELRNPQLIGDFNKAQKNDPSIRHILQLLENNESYQEKQGIALNKAELRINKLKNLINGPSVVRGDYFCDGNLLDSLEGVALIIEKNFDCSFSLLKNKCSINT